MVCSSVVLNLRFCVSRSHKASTLHIMSQQFCERAQNITRYKFQEKSQPNDEFHKSLDIDNKRDGQFKVDNRMIEKIEM